MKNNWYVPGKWKVTPLTRCEKIKEQMPLLPDRFYVRDVTLKEGHDAPGANFSLKGTLKIVEKLAEIGVPEIDVGRPTFVDMDMKQMKAIKKAGIPIICSPNIGETLIKYDLKEHIDRCFEGGADNIKMVVVHTYSEDILIHLERVLEAIEYVHSQYKSTISVSWDDTTKLDLEVAKYMYHEAAEAGIDRLWVSDEGNATHLSFKYLTSEIRKVTGDIPLVLHCHNDFGLAVTNTLAGVEAGASWADVAVNGLGDRGGNAAMEEVVCCLEMLYGTDTGIKMDQLTAMSQVVQEVTGIETQPNKAITGRNAAIDTGAFLLMEVPIDEHISINPEVFGRKHTMAFGMEGTLQDGTIEAGLKRFGLKHTKGDIERIKRALKKELEKEILVKKKKNFLVLEEFEEIARKVLKSKK